MFSRSLSTSVAVLSGAVWLGSAFAEPPADWSDLPEQQLSLFYPGQSSYQWLRGPGHAGQARVLKDAPCRSCHVDETVLGESLVAGGPLEPHRLPGKKPIIELTMQAAYDEKTLYLRFQWETQNPFPGVAHPHWRFDGTRWSRYGAPRLHSDVWRDGKPAIYEDRLSLMIDDGSVPAFAEQGCWLSCHEGMRDMPAAPDTDAVRGHPLLGRVLHKDDVRKYLPGSREGEAASWDRTKPASEIATMMGHGRFIDLMQWRAHRSNPVGMADDGYVLEYRLSDAGQPVFETNWDKEAERPAYMFDPAKVGFRALAAEDLADPAKVEALILEENAAPFDPALDWVEGELIPEYVLSRDSASGSAADNAQVEGTWQDGRWTVVWARPLDTGHPDDKALRPGSAVTVGIAVHDDNITTRGHHVSFPFTLGLGIEAEVSAVQIP